LYGILYITSLDIESSLGVLYGTSPNIEGLCGVLYSTSLDIEGLSGVLYSTSPGIFVTNSEGASPLEKINLAYSHTYRKNHIIIVNFNYIFCYRTVIAQGIRTYQKR
jgi:hypothetical protein